MKITHGEIRGTIVLLIIIFIVLGAIWFAGPKRNALTDGEGETPIEYFPDDSALIAERSDKYEASHGDKPRHRSDSTHRRKRAKAPRKRTPAAPAPDRNSPLVSPAN